MASWPVGAGVQLQDWIELVKDETTQRGVGRQAAGDEGDSLKKRVVQIFLRLAIWCAVAAVLFFGIRGACRGLQRVFLTDNPHFTLRNIDINVKGNLPRAEIERRLEAWKVRKGQSNLFELDIPVLRDRLMKFVLVSKADFRIKLPSTLEVDVTERVPAVRIIGGHLMDSEGWILPEVGQGGAKQDALPVVFNLKEGMRTPTGKRAEDEMSRAVLCLLRLTGTRPYGRLFDVKGVQCDTEQRALRVHLRARNTFVEGAQMVVPAGSEVEIDAALLRVEKIAAERMQAQQLTKFIDATYMVNVPVLGEGPGDAATTGQPPGGTSGTTALATAGTAGVAPVSPLVSGAGAGVKKPGNGALHQVTPKGGSGGKTTVHPVVKQPWKKATVKTSAAKAPVKKLPPAGGTP